MSAKTKHFFEFDGFRLDATERLLLRDGEALPLTPKAFDTLLVLIEHRGHLVTKEELMQAVWRDAFVEEAGLTRNISSLRKVFGQDANGCKFIETVPKHGYRFVAEVVEVGGSTPDLVIERLTTAKIITREEQELIPNHKRTFWQSPYAIMAAAALFMAALAAVLLLRDKTNPVETPVQSIAVLPFRIIGTSALKDDFGLAIADTLITKLSNSKELTVRPTSKISNYAEGESDTIEIGRTLQVDAVLEGSLQTSDDKVRVTLRVIRVRDGSSLWAKVTDERFTNLLALEDAISKQLLDAPFFKSSASERESLAKHYTQNAQAYEAYLRGTHHFRKGTIEELLTSINDFKQAIALDPDYPLPYTKLAVAYVLLNNFGAVNAQEVTTQAGQAANKAVELDDKLADAHLALFFIHWQYEYDWAAADREMQRALELNLNSPSVHNTRAHFLMCQGKTEEAVAESRLALELDPTDYGMVEDLAWSYLIAGKHEEAKEQCQRAMAMSPQEYGPHLYLGWLYEQNGIYDKAIEELQRARTLSANSPHVIAALGHALAAAGNRNEAEKMIKELQSLSKGGYTSPYFMAILYGGLGEKEKALNYLEAACNEHNSEMVFLKMERRFNHLRFEPHFKRLLQRIGLES